MPLWDWPIQLLRAEKTKFRVFAALLFLSLAFSIPGLASADLPRFRNFGLASGLSTSSVTRICQDQEGKIWVATHDGLNCFYGSFFKTYYQSSDSGSGLNQSAISDILCDKKGILWIASYGGGLNWMDPISQTFLPLPAVLAKLPWKQINCLAQDPEGRIWMGYYEGLAVFDPATGTLQTLRNLTEKKEEFPVSKIAFDGNGLAWIATPFQGIQLFKRKSLTHLGGLSFSDFGTEKKGIGFFHQLYDRGNAILACTQTGLFLLEWDGEKVVKSRPGGFPDGEFLASHRDALGRNWLALSGSGFRLWTESGQEVPVQLPYIQSFQGGRIIDFFQDKWGGIWLAGSDGLSYTHPQLGKFSSWTFGNGMPTMPLKIVWSLFTQNDRDFLLGTETGLYRYSTINYAFKALLHPELGTPLLSYCFLQTRNGRILTGTSQGVFEIKGDLVLPIWKSVSGFISSVFELPDGTFIVATYDERGVFQVTADGQIKTHYQHQEGKEFMPNNSINILRSSTEKGVWMGTDLGFTHFDPIEKRFDNSLWDWLKTGRKISPLIYDLLDMPDQLWVATYGSGIWIIDKQRRTVKKLGISEGLPNESVYRMERQGQQVWASTNKGLIRISIRDLSFRVFTEGDGLQSNEFNHFASFSNPQSGRIYFGGIKGFDEASRYLEPINVNPPRMVLSAARLISNSGEKALSLNSSNWEFGYQDHNLELEFAALNYLMPEKNKYFYELQSTRTDRISLGEKNKITLINLQPGEYTLRIFGTNNEGVVTRKPLVLNFLIRPPFWQTWTFRLFVLAVVLGLLFWIFRLYLKARLREQILAFERMEAVRKERNRISAEMHDDLGSGLTSIKMLSELVRIKAGHQPFAELGKISDRSEELVENLNTIVWALNDRNDRLEHMVAYFRSWIRNRFEEFPGNLALEVSVEPGLAQVEIPGESRRHLFLMVKETVHNIFKHSGATEVRIRIEAKSKFLEMEFSDNGAGKSEKSISGGNGLRNMEIRAKALQGTIRFSTNPGFQTWIRIPIYNERGIAGLSRNPNL